MVKARKLLVDSCVAFLASSVTAVVCYPIADAIGYQTVGLIFLIVVAGLSLFLGRGALIFAAILSFAVWNFLFISPLYTFRVHHLHDLISLFANLSVAIVGSAFISRIRKSQLSLKKSQERLTVLYGFLESLNNAVSIQDVMSRAQRLMKQHFDAEMISYLRSNEQETLSMIPYGNTGMHSANLWKKAVAVFSGAEAGNQLIPVDGHGQVRFIPMEEPRKKIGILIVSFPIDSLHNTEKLTMLKSFTDQITSAIDREISIQIAQEKDIFNKSEKLFRTVLNSVSHELKTPISIISAAISNLRDERTSANRDLRKQIILELDQASERLNHIVENILDMSRIESGVVKLNLQYCDVEDLIGTLVNGVKSELRYHQLEIEIQKDIPMILIDMTLLTQALTNIVRNAIEYSTARSTIRIASSKEEGEKVNICVINQGPGIPETSLPRLFEKFYRVPGTKPGGTGLGLTISKAIFDAHGGTLTVRNTPQGGVLVQGVLPLKTD